MSRSRRPANYGKCICGRRLVHYADRGSRKLGLCCPTLDYTHEHNREFARFVASKAPSIEDASGDGGGL